MWQYEGVARVTRAESKERTRQRLLAEAQRLFRERGYAATSLEQIAEAAEVTKGAIYGHFASKEDLLFLVHKTAMERGLKPVFEAAAREREAQADAAGQERVGDRVQRCSESERP